MLHYSRRMFLRSATGFAAAAPLLSTLAARNAFAADTSGYKALVCMYFQGGLDSTDMVLPTDEASHRALAALRPGLLSEHSVSRAPADLLSLNAKRGDRGFGLPANMGELASLFNSGRAAMVANVGPLVEPVTRADIESLTATLPDRLYSHNDQRSVWFSGETEGARTGWGGRMIDITLRSDPSRAAFAAPATNGSGVFLQGELSREFPLPLGSPRTLDALKPFQPFGTASGSSRVRQLLREHLRSAQPPASGNILIGDVGAINRRGLDNLDTYIEATASAVTLATPFPNTSYGAQLKQIAQTISISGALGASRQIFHASRTGFDSHAAQVGGLSDNVGEISDAIGAFDAAMTEIGMSDSVTLFTASEFGRTLVENGSGTDHGWGGHHFVVGGAVEGGRIIGEVPPYDLADPLYTPDGRGRLIPTLSVDQLGATLGRWFGLNDTDLGEVFPNLGNFSTRDLGLFRT